jgi:hypothetical protein
VLRLPGFTRFLQVLHQVYAALRLSSSPENAQLCTEVGGRDRFSASARGYSQVLEFKGKIFPGTWGIAKCFELT